MRIFSWKRFLHLIFPCDIFFYGVEFARRPILATVLLIAVLPGDAGGGGKHDKNQSKEV